MDTPFIVYLSGDKGSAELRKLCAIKDVPIIEKDIREKREHLVRLLRLNKTTVPQVFTGNGAYVGDYDAFHAYLETLPTPEVAQLHIEHAD